MCGYSEVRWGEDERTRNSPNTWTLLLWMLNRAFSWFVELFILFVRLISQTKLTPWVWHFGVFWLIKAEIWICKFAVLGATRTHFQLLSVCFLSEERLHFTAADCRVCGLVCVCGRFCLNWRTEVNELRPSSLTQTRSHCWFSHLRLTGWFLCEPTVIRNQNTQPLKSFSSVLLSFTKLRDPIWPQSFYMNSAAVKN